MADAVRLIKIAAAAAVAALLSGCLTSDTPLLNDTNAKAKPLSPGAYQSCDVGEPDESGAPECRAVVVTLEGALYSIAPQGEDVTLARFKSLGSKAFLAQMSEEGEGGFFYFYVVKTADGVKMSMVDCPEIPQRTRDSLVRSGGLEVSSDGRSCTAKTLRAAERATKAYGRTLSDASNWTVLKRTGP